MRITDPASLGLVLPACIFLPLSVAAAPAEEAGPTAMDPIVVTATLGPRTQGESLSSVTVIDEEEIERQQPAEMQDLLQGQPGINVISNGSFGKTTSVFTRGTSSESTVLLIDGIRLRSATNGSAPWQHVPVSMINRMEIVRGPRSSLYGADAVGGVVQAFLPEPGQATEGWVELGGGSFDTRQGGAGFSASRGDTGMTLSGFHRETDGTAIIEDGEDRGHRNTDGFGRVVHQLDNGGKASVLFMQSTGNSEFEGGNTDFMVRTIGGSLEAPVSDNWRTGIRLSESRDEQDRFGSTESWFNTTSRTARWDNTLALGRHELVIGGELQNDEVDTSESYDENSRTNAALFTQASFNFGPADLQLSLRGDDNEAFGKETTGGVAAGYQFDAHHRVRAGYNTAFRAPTFNDLYYPEEDYGSVIFVGNPDLKPEESESLELGASGRYAHWFWDVALYQLEVDNLIAWTPGDPYYSPRNVNNARIRGLELSSGFELDQWQAKAALTLQDPRDRDSDNRLTRRTAQSLRLDLDRTIGNWNLGGTLLAEGYRYDDPENEDRLPGFATLDLRAGWQFAEDWSTRLTVANVLDKEYSTARYDDDHKYIAAGRTALLTVRYDIR
ncbi:TonB-dependent receptor domain-containing protein [Marinobacter lacisalsi]|uniref:TonB-dependent receptor domain-containing protein n=1 Tax=Marinobacter lacisalsi TaxID=475979 RepID=A0ABV8QN18_9GAMM